MFNCPKEICAFPVGVGRSSSCRVVVRRLKFIHSKKVRKFHIRAHGQHDAIGKSRPISEARLGWGESRRNLRSEHLKIAIEELQLGSIGELN